MRVDLRASGLRTLPCLHKFKGCDHLRIHQNHLKDIYGIEVLTDLVNLKMGDNQITDITPIRGMKKLKYVGIYNNNISDISVLLELPSLIDVELMDNPLSKESLEVIKKLKERGVAIRQ